MQSYVIWGSSGHAKVLGSLINLRGGRIVALFDNNPEALPAINNVPLYIGLKGFECWFNEQIEVHNIRGIVAIGGARGRDRLIINDLFSAHQLQTQPLVHPFASVCSTVTIGQGTQVLSQAIIAADTKIGKSCIINHRASVDHECVVGNGVHLAPASTLCGCITLGDNVMIGANATILPRITIGDDTIVGAGAVVTRNLPEGIVAFGNPARIIRNIHSSH